MRFLLESNRGVATIMETLGKARQIEHTDFSRQTGEIVGFRHGPPPVIECKTLRGKWTTRADSAALDPDAVLPPVRGSLESGQRRLEARHGVIPILGVANCTGRPLTGRLLGAGGK